MNKKEKNGNTKRKQKKEERPVLTLSVVVNGKKLTQEEMDNFVITNKAYLTYIRQIRKDINERLAKERLAKNAIK